MSTIEGVSYIPPIKNLQLYVANMNGPQIKCANVSCLRNKNGICGLKNVEFEWDGENRLECKNYKKAI